MSLRIEQTRSGLSPYVMELTLTPEATAAGPDGNVRWEFSLMSESAHLSGKGAIDLTSQGVVRHTEVHLSDMPMMERHILIARVLERLSVPWPEEPIGVGARWEVTRMVDETWTDVRLASVFRLDSVEGARCSVHVEATLQGDHQFLDIPNTPLGEREVLWLKGVETADLEVSLAQAPIGLGSMAQTSERETLVHTYSTKAGMRTARERTVHGLNATLAAIGSP
jgi:hypothetical protein